tara:strand:+ start:510 stop:1400 length:891 start_codon:yes stop_codon:yes gene_type:complete
MDENLKNKAIEILEKDQNQMKGVFDRQTDVEAPETTEKVEITQNADGTWNESRTEEKRKYKDEAVVDEKEREIEEDARTLQEFCAAVDGKILGILTQIDDKKREIVTLSLQAGTQMNCASTQGVGFTCVNMQEEVEYISIYNKMAGPDVDYGVENPFEPDNTSALTEPYVGYGRSNIGETLIFQNSGGTPTGFKTDGSGAGINTFARFDLSGSGTPASGGSSCGALSSQIADLYGNIRTLRDEITSLRGDLNIVKDKKAEKELMNWGCKNTRRDVEKRQTANAGIISSTTNLFNAI